METSNETVSLKIPAKSEFVGVARLTVSGIANRMGFNYDDIEDIKIAVSEACTNVVNHAYKNVDEGQIEINLNCSETSLTITVIDQGNCFEVDKVLNELKPIDVTMSLNQINEGGLGLFLINTLMDEVNISSGSGIIVKMSKLLNRDEVDMNANRVSTTTE
ncbi:MULTISPECIES: anti-sigma B factor RsbW [Terrilactibacillus]|uniref:Anti-sigma B factor RsbW n=3 Tax=Terrilactibacillus TaxID=1795633 RepID=A0A6N8CSK3_9BACI|nr:MULTISPECIES: anti-sigma B factor RsbW [Terrilactibacillus]MTT33134.1 anti-sigma B factor RsbW [Terrilactibacillus tamarindi]